MVTEAVSSSGRERQYAYEGTLMTEISDENKKILLHNWYLPRGVLVKQRFGNSATYSYDYDWPANTYNSQSVTVIFQNGTAKNVRVADSVPEYVRDFHK